MSPTSSSSNNKNNQSRTNSTSRRSNSTHTQQSSTSWNGVVPEDEEEYHRPVTNNKEQSTSTNSSATSSSIIISTPTIINKNDDPSSIQNFSMSELIAVLSAPAHVTATSGGNIPIGDGGPSSSTTTGAAARMPDWIQCNPELERRVLDFRLAQSKRRDKYNNERSSNNTTTTNPNHTGIGGIFGLYAHISNVRIDLEWAEDAAYRRQNGKPYLSWADFDQARQIGHHNRPYFTYGLIIICTIMLIVEIGLNDWQFESLKVNPLIGPSANALVRAGARDTAKIIQDNQWFRIITPLILHAGLIHYLINMLALWFIGRAVEEMHGWMNAALLFVLPGIGGNILSAIFLPQYISVGASGGLFGLIGGCIADITLNWNLLLIQPPPTIPPPNSNDNETNPLTYEQIQKKQHRQITRSAIIWLVADILINTVIGLTPFVDNFCHLGGIIYGLCCGWSIMEPMTIGLLAFFPSSGTASTTTTTTSHLLSREKMKLFSARFIGFGFSVIAIMVTTSILATRHVSSTTGIVTNSPCPKCRYISCVPFPIFQKDKWWYCDDCDSVVADLYSSKTTSTSSSSTKTAASTSSSSTTSASLSTSSTVGQDGGYYYTSITLTCPNNVQENIDISKQRITDRNTVRHQLPSYCREYCASHFK